MSANGVFRAPGTSIATAMADYRAQFVQRVRCHPPLTKMQLAVVALLSDGKTNEEIARVLGLVERTVQWHITEARNRIPGELPGASKLIVWYRGATMAVLDPKSVPVRP